MLVRRLVVEGVLFCGWVPEVEDVGVVGCGRVVVGINVCVCVCECLCVCV